MKNRCILTLLSVISLLLCLEAHAASSVRISIDAPNPNKIEVGESFHITVEAVNCSGKLDVTQMPPGVKVVYHTSSQTTSQSIVNGKSEVRNVTSLIMTCKGNSEGKYSFGPVSVDGVKSNTVSYQIVAATAGGGNSKGSGTSSGAQNSGGTGSYYDPNSGPVFIGKGNEEMFLRANVNKTTAYEQEAIEYVVKLFTTYGDIKFLGAAAAPKFDGFVIEESNDVSTSFKFEDYNGKTYKTAVIARYIIFPQKSGKLKVIGNTYTVSTDAQQYYHDPYFQTLTVKYPVQLNVTPNEVEINVKELPTPVPDNFIGGVGKFSISSSMPTLTLSSNSPATLIYKVEGTGNVKYVKLPDLSKYFPSSIEVYTPEITSEIKVGTSNVSGTTTFDYSIVPRETGEFVIPALTLSYFDPEAGVYKTLSSHEYKINVSMGQQSSKSQQAMTFDPSIIPNGNLTRDAGSPLVDKWWYWLWYVVPFVLFLISLGAYRKYVREHEDMVSLKSKKANKMALRRLAKAYKYLKNDQEEQFYDEMLYALWGYIGDKLKMPTSELNRSNVGEEFKSHNVKESTFMPIINLIDECEYAKYTPVSRKANMKQLYTDALQSLARVENEYDEQKGIKNNDDEDDDSKIGDNYVNTSKPTDTID